jgi:hypothetical protein
MPSVFIFHAFDVAALWTAEEVATVAAGALFHEIEKPMAVEVLA